MRQKSNIICNSKSPYYPCYISTDKNINNQSISPMTNESNTESSYPELVSSQSDVALISIDTESLALSQDSDTVDIWSQLPVRKYTDERTDKNK